MYIVKQVRNNFGIGKDCFFRQNSFVGIFPIEKICSKILYVETDLAGRRFIRLELKGTAQPLVEITPAVPFYAGKLQAGQVYEFRFELKPSQSGVVLSAAADSGCRLKKSEGKWLAVCKLTPASGTAIVEKEFRIDVVSPAGQPPLSIRIRGLLAD